MTEDQFLKAAFVNYDCSAFCASTVRIQNLKPIKAKFNSIRFRILRTAKRQREALRSELNE